MRTYQNGNGTFTVFISQPMIGLSDNDILQTRAMILHDIQNKYGGKAILSDSFISEDIAGKNPNLSKDRVGLLYLAKSLEVLAKSDAAYFGPGWEQERGCKLEHACAKAYGIPTVYYNDVG